MKVLPLGGLGEIGMNCMVLDDGRDALIVDCGVSFGDREFGVDVLHPSFDALDELSVRLRGVVITHGHEDHIGALPYLLSRFQLPVFAPRYALELLQHRSREHEVLTHARFELLEPKKPLKLGKIVVKPIAVDHSIADALALHFETAGGRVFHSGDFKFEGEASVFDAEHARELCAGGVDLLLSDSTNVDVVGSAREELAVAQSLQEHIDDAAGMVVVSLFASNTHRMAALGKIAAKTGRKIVLLGRSMETHARIARAIRAFDWPSDLVWPRERIRELPAHGRLVLATGSQGEPQGALARIACGDMPDIRLTGGDRVLLSSRVIPGNEVEVARIIDSLLRSGAEVRTATEFRDIHASGHACRADQVRLLELTNPRAFVPIHGTLRHLQRHAALAVEVGVKSALVLENGTTGVLAPAGIARGDTFTTGRVRRAFGDEIGDEVLRDRRTLASRGALSVLVVVDRTQLRVRELQVRARGVHAEAPEGLAARTSQLLHEQIELRPARLSEEEIRDLARVAVRRACQAFYGFKAETLVHVYLV